MAADLNIHEYSTIWHTILGHAAQPVTIPLAFSKRLILGEDEHHRALLSLIRDAAASLSIGGPVSFRQHIAEEPHTPQAEKRRNDDIALIHAGADNIERRTKSPSGARHETFAGKSEMP